MSSTLSASSSSSVAVGSFDDHALTAWLEDCLARRQKVGYVHAEYLCRVVNLSDASSALYFADPGQKAKGVLKRLVGKGLLSALEMSLNELANAHVADDGWGWSLILDKPNVDRMISQRDGLLGKTSGRGPEISEKTAHKVWADAGARCMFEGCGRDLSEVPLWTKAARVGYLAHIVASDPEGPRGTQSDSHRLANVPDNIMLMCDEHHRLIDSFAPHFYTAEILNEMRQVHRNIVRSYLDSLAFPRIKAVTLHANLANVPTYFHDSELIEAIVASKRAMEPGVLHYVRRKAQRDDRHLPEFWPQYLREHENDIRQLVTGFNANGGAHVENLAIFPLHHIPTLVLVGRVMGEAQAIQLFQYDKERKSWAWDSKNKAHPPGSFSVGSLPSDRVDEVLITLELTASLDESALSDDLKEAINTGRIVWIRLTSSKTGFNCIGHPDDLDQFSQSARKAIVHVQDVMRVRKIHLIALSPASTVFRFGQMLQAGHHPECVVYDRASRDHKFFPALSITGHHVSATDGHQSAKISLR